MSRTKQELEQLKEIARMYYMQGEEQKEIAKRLSLSAVTISRWAKDGSWLEKKNGNAISRKELVNRILQSIERKIEELNSTNDPVIFDTIVTQLTKLSNTIEKLDKDTNIVTIMEVFRAFHEWMKSRMGYDNITPELLQTINRYQDMFINEQLTNNIK